MSSVVEIIENNSTVTIANGAIVEVKKELVNVVEVGTQGPQGIPGLPALRALTVEYFEPQNIQAVANQFDILEVTSELFANGLTVNEVRISTIPSSTYSLDILKMAGPNDSSPVTIATVSTNSSDTATQAVDEDLEVGEYLGLSLPLTGLLHISIQFLLEPKEM